MNEAANPPSISKPRILCVDDEASILSSLERLLVRDFEVLTAQTAAAAMECLKSVSDIAIVLTDHRMPEMTGLELLTECQQKFPETVRALLSGQVDIEVIMDAVNTATIHRFILKPWENDYLKLQMKESCTTWKLLEERRLLQEWRFPTHSHG